MKKVALFSIIFEPPFTLHAAPQFLTEQTTDGGGEDEETSSSSSSEEEEDGEEEDEDSASESTGERPLEPKGISPEVLERLSGLHGLDLMVESAWETMQPELDTISKKIVEMQEQQLVSK